MGPNKCDSCGLELEGYCAWVAYPPGTGTMCFDCYDAFMHEWNIVHVGNGFYKLWRQDGEVRYVRSIEEAYRVAKIYKYHDQKDG